jgi:cytochrome c biogenesis protein CcmG/thiol:disulfide interchange protein DsbE
LSVATGPTQPASPGRRRPRRLRALLVGTVIAAALAAYLFVGLGIGRQSTPTGVAGVGSTVPDFTVSRLGGGAPVHLDALGVDRHRPVVLNFFASWCTPCRTETPMLAAAAKQAQVSGSPVQFVGIDVNDQTSPALAFVDQAGISYPVGVDPTFRVSSGLYGIVGLPDTVFVDASGRIVGRHLGPLTRAGLDQWLHRLSPATPSGR